MSEAMQSVMSYLETGIGDFWGWLYDLSRDELTNLLKELDYAGYLEYGSEGQRKVYAKTAENLKGIYQEDE